jgi:hypothetical protein
LGWFTQNSSKSAKSQPKTPLNCKIQAQTLGKVEKTLPIYRKHGANTSKLQEESKNSIMASIGSLPLPQNSMGTAE